MDRNDPPIIKSGARHSVQIAQGTKNAKSVRNVVTSDVDAPIADRFVSAEETVQRQAAVLKQGVTQTLEAEKDRIISIAEDAAPSAGMATVVVEQDQHGSGQVLAEEGAPAQGQMAAGPTLLREERGAQDVQVAKAPVAAENRILIDAEPGPADTEGVVVEGRQSLENRQRIEQLQAQAQRIRLDAQARPTQTLNAVAAGQSVAKDFQLGAELEASAPSADEASPAPVAETPQPVAEAPAEVMANLDHQAAPAGGVVVEKESALMARLRALKSNMSVTENRLTQLKPPGSA